MRHRLSAFIDGELGAEDRLRVAAHLESCASCADDVEALREPGRALSASFARVNSPAGAALRVLAAIERRGVAQPGTRLASILLEWACAAAAVLLAALVFALTHTDRPVRGGTDEFRRIIVGTEDPEEAAAPPRSESDLISAILADPATSALAAERER